MALRPLWALPCTCCSNMSLSPHHSKPLCFLTRKRAAIPAWQHLRVGWVMMQPESLPGPDKTFFLSPQHYCFTQQGSGLWARVLPVPIGTSSGICERIVGDETIIQIQIFPSSGMCGCCKCVGPSCRNYSSSRNSSSCIGNSNSSNSNSADGSYLSSSQQEEQQ